jgi:hypothetical protein
MPSLNWIQCELESLLSSPWYSSIFYNLNEFRTRSLDGPNGGSTSTNSAGTLGPCWFSRELMENLWISTAGMGEGRNRKSHFKHLMRACNLVLFEWNAMTQIACMKLPDDSRVAVVSGEGNWGAMMPKGTSRGGGAPLKKSFTRQLSRMSTEPTIQ